MIILAHLGCQCTEFYAARWTCWFFTFFYLESYIWTDAILRWIQFHDASDFAQISERVQQRPWQGLDKRSGKKEFAVSVQAVNSTYYCDILRQLRENVWRLCPKLWWQRNWLLHHDNTLLHISFFTREFFNKSIMTAVPHTLLFSISLREDKTERLPFWHKWGDWGRIAGGA
jgi:hypothetical protein